ncbi:hypothetical protein P879_08295 [Paragonimus westermani]|uniref:Spliceosome-associated protein CWC27 homolog n=1 Tax=Paragonimus westermani TaxID=34504 RepID=A0A8T0DCZ9_9TREM|nr:hypothetical protein P879_08295 [Paragonimus westermani]
MSNIYVSEPATNGKVILKTTVGEIEIELWSKEAPKACRNFVQLCMEGYYDDTAFHRLVRGFIVQGGDPTGTGEGGESIYGHPFKTEIHSRLSFNRRGLVGMACLAENVNASQFFFTLGAAPELTGKHTLFGKVAGETLFNMLRLGEGEVGSDERPHRLHRIVNTKVILNPYDDIVPRQLVPRSGPVKDTEDDSDKVTAKATKNFSLLSFGEEAEEEEQVTTVVSEKLRKKGKSAHDLLSDPRLSSQPVIINEEDRAAVARASLEAEKEAELRRRRRQQAKEEDPESDEAKAKRIAALREEAEQLRREILQSKRLEAQRHNQLQADLEREQRELREREQAEADALARWEARQLMGDEVDTKNKPIVVDPDTFSAELAGYKAKAKKTKQGSDREAETMVLLSKFTSRLRSVVDPTDEDTKRNKFSAMDNWMSSQLISETPAPTKQVIDPTMPNPDRYDLYDPRNPLNIRKRGGDAAADSGLGVSKRNRRP